MRFREPTGSFGKFFMRKHKKLAKASFSCESIKTYQNFLLAHEISQFCVFILQHLSLLQLFSEGTQNDDDDVLVALWFMMTRSPVVLRVA